MKKKGLIIATIVMVLVLAVSLTTATYAWFTNEGTAKVDTINFSVKSASDVMIGVAAANTYDSSKTLTNFVSGGTSYTVGSDAWTGGSGLGLEVNHNITLAMEKAIYSFNNITDDNHTNVYFATSTEDAEGAALGSAIMTEYTFVSGTAIVDGNYYVQCASASAEGYSFTAYKTSELAYIVGTQDAYDTDSDAEGNQNANIAGQIPTGIDHGTSGHQILKASGEGAELTVGSLATTSKNVDYVDIAFGALASNPQLLGYGMVVHVRPTDTKSTLGVNAAIHVAYNKNNTGWKEFDIYGTNDRNTVKDEMSLPTVPSWTSTSGTHTYSTSIEGSVLNGLTQGDALLYIPLYESEDGSACAPTTAENLQQVQLVVYLCGPDPDCITASTGVSAVLTIEFISLQKTNA